MPGEFLPGAQAAFLTSATMAALAGVAAVAGLAVAAEGCDTRRVMTG